jgi:hypothetical protein
MFNKNPFKRILDFSEGKNSFKKNSLKRKIILFLFYRRDIINKSKMG